MLRVFFALFVLMLCAASALAAPRNTVVETFEGRDMIIAVPSRMPPAGARGLVVVLHGGMGSAEHVEDRRAEHALSMDAMGEKNGFLVVYLNGTRVARLLGSQREGWNAGGGCCGLPAKRNVDDVGYITHAVARLVDEYGVDPRRVFGMGHSNGAMMTQRLMCETDLYAAAVVISGPLNLDTESCPAARGKRILALHGVDDRNVPVAGGDGTKGWSRATYQSESHTQQVFTNSGATYDLRLLKDADHELEHINSVFQRTEGISIPEEATRFFGLQRQD